MSKFYGNVGFVKDEETKPGVWTKTNIEHPYYGDVIQLNRRWDEQTEVNDHLNLNEEISVVADSYILSNLSYIKYVVYLGVKWRVTAITPKHPRIILNLGGEYNE